MTMIDHSNSLLNNEHAQSTWRDLIRAVPDFPKSGIMFRDVMPMLRDPFAYDMAIGAMSEAYLDENIEQVIGLDARGFIFGGAMAMELDAGFTAVRKAGKLPGNNHRINYGLEYGKATFELPVGSVAGRRCLVVDDLLATGGSMAAACELVKRDGGIIVGVVFMIELTGLGGRAKIHATVGNDVDVFALLNY